LISTLINNFDLTRHAENETATDEGQNLETSDDGIAQLEILATPSAPNPSRSNGPYDVSQFTRTPLAMGTPRTPYTADSDTSHVPERYILSIYLD
jgi:hypothetical protein